MGMTIEEAIKELSEFKDKSWDGMPEEVIDLAIDTMRKYQKIEQIVKSKTTRLSYDIGFEQIKGVIDGNNA